MTSAAAKAIEASWIQNQPSTAKTRPADRFETCFAGKEIVEALRASLRVRGDNVETNLAPSSWPFLAALLQRLDPKVPILLVTSGAKQQENLHQDLQTWQNWLGSRLNQKPEAKEKGKDLECPPLAFFPAWESLPHEAKLSHVDVISERLETLMALQAFGERAGEEAPLVVASLAAVLQKTFSPGELARRVKRIQAGQSLNPLDFVEWLEEQAYEPEAKVTQKGELALRGGIVDVFPLASPWPIRVEFFGNEVDSIRQFDPHTQMSQKKVNFADVSPAGEIGILLPQMDKATKSGRGKIVSSLSDYLPKSAILIVCDPEEVEAQAERYAERVPDKDPFLETWPAFLERVRADGVRILRWADGLEGERAHFVAADSEEDGRVGLPVFESLEAHRPPNDEAFDLPAAEQWRRQFFGQIHRWLRQGHRVDVFCNNAGERDRFLEIWSELSWAEESFADGSLNVEVGMLGRGFLAESVRWAAVTDAEIFGRYKVQRPRRLKSKHVAAMRSALEIDFSDLEEGDFVVHLQHGIGRFVGLQRMLPAARFSGEPNSEVSENLGPECLVIEYASRDPQQTLPRLYVPVIESHLVSKYIGAGKAVPALSVLGGSQWSRAKARAEKAVVDLAGEMLSIQAARESEEGHAFPPDTHWQREFESAFLYEETADQSRAIESSKRDMESSRPMDRLICGDVGFGKTEVAIRAAFKAVMGGKQVAVLVPTTVLAQQHYKNLSERMRDYPVRIELLSRFQKSRAAAVLQSLANGSADVVVGTHRLVQEDVKFKNLGLAIIDEEQRFGVAHKEKFKRLRQLVDVLTLSATPIPRTLHMALVGARDMSTIETPPHDRLPVQTFVMPYEERVIQDAIQKELNRQGQVYFLHNRVATIDAVAEKIRRLVPEARVAVGHGQMAAKTLEQTMIGFVDGKIDVLVSTTIIESGLDIPNANTIIIDRADRFGLSDLYQLRGRVGRYKHQAYAYLLLPRHAGLLSDARKRIHAMKQYSRLGSGFKIAMRDLEIRGAGNMLGPQQSGHITAVGFELYCQLLKQSVASLQGKTVKPRTTVPVKFDFLALNPGDKPREAGRSRTGKTMGAQRLRDPLDPKAAGKSLPAHSQRHPVTIARLPYNYIAETQQRIEIYRKLAQVNDQESLNQLKNELRDRYGPLPQTVKLLLLVAEVKWLAGERNIRSVEIRDGKVMLERNRDFIMFDGRFPRLTGKAPEAKLKELRRLLLSLPPTDAERSKH